MLLFWAFWSSKNPEIKRLMISTKGFTCFKSNKLQKVVSYHDFTVVKKKT